MIIYALALFCSVIFMVLAGCVFVIAIIPVGIIIWTLVVIVLIIHWIVGNIQEEK